ncbi:hypothetical protein D3C73_1019340 [compost metagenome]
MAIGKCLEGATVRCCAIEQLAGTVYDTGIDNSRVSCTVPPSVRPLTMQLLLIEFTFVFVTIGKIIGAFITFVS